MSNPRPSTSPATIQDVADLAGVSRAAVSKVIRNAYGVSEAMRTRVTEAIDTLGYRPSVTARALRGASFTIGIELPTLGNPFLTKIVMGATDYLVDSGYQLIMASAPAGGVEGMKEIEALVDRQVAGLIVISPIVSVAWLEQQARTIPIVMLGRHDATGAYDTVTDDDVLGTRLLMNHLFAQGHRRIAHLTMREQVTAENAHSPHGERLQEYIRIMTEAGLAEHIQIGRIGVGERGAYERSRELLDAPVRPTAIFAGSDFVAMETQRAMADVGLSAADIAVVGYDEIPMSGHPGVSLTTIDQDGHALGQHAARLLLERIGGRTTAEHVQITPTLVVRRSSTTAPRPLS